MTIMVTYVRVVSIGLSLYISFMCVLHPFYVTLALLLCSFRITYPFIVY